MVWLGGAALMLWASNPGRIHGTVTESLHGHALGGAFMGLARTADDSWVAGVGTDLEGKYEFTGLSADDYTVSAGCYGYQSEAADVSVAAGSDVTQDFVLDPITANIKADVLSIDQTDGGRTGGWRSVQVRITYQMMCHDPVRLVVWAYGGNPTARPHVIFDSGETTWWWTYSSYLDSTVNPNPTSSGYDTVETLRLPWDTVWVPNGPYTIKAALKCCDPHGDGTDENPDPAAETWVHWAGSPPTATADGTPGGTTLSVAVANVVITGYSATPSAHPQHYFKYDADGGDPLDSPQVTATVDNWQNEPMELVVWMVATAWGDTRPNPYTDPYMTLAIGAPGTYTLTWDGSNPGVPPLGWGPGEAPWGTYTYDIDVHKPSCAASTDRFFAKTHDGWSTEYSTIYDTLFGDHSVQWTQATVGDPLVLRCTYEVGSDSDTPPAWVRLVPVDPDLNEQGCVSGGTDLEIIHDGIPPTGDGSGPGIATYSTTNPDDTAGTWRVVLTGQTASGAEHRRDGTNPVMLATNQTKAIERLVILCQSDPGLTDHNVYKGADDPWSMVDLVKAFTEPPGPDVLVRWFACAMEYKTASPTGYSYMSYYALPTSAQMSYLRSQHLARHVVTLCDDATKTNLGGTFQRDATGEAGQPDACFFNRALAVSHPSAPTPVTGPAKSWALAHTIVHELGHSAGTEEHENDLECVMSQSIQGSFWGCFWGTSWDDAGHAWHVTNANHRRQHGNAVRAHLGYPPLD